MKRMSETEIGMLAIITQVLRRTLEEMEDVDAAQLNPRVLTSGKGEEIWGEAREQIFALRVELEDYVPNYLLEKTSYGQ